MVVHPIRYFTSIFDLKNNGLVTPKFCGIVNGRTRTSNMEFLRRCRTITKLLYLKTRIIPKILYKLAGSVYDPWNSHSIVPQLLYQFHYYWLYHPLDKKVGTYTYILYKWAFYMSFYLRFFSTYFMQIRNILHKGHKHFYYSIFAYNTVMVGMPFFILQYI